MQTNSYSLYRRAVQRACHQMQAQIEAAKANLPQLHLADQIAARLCAVGLKAVADSDATVLPFIVLQVPIETLGHVDAEDLVQMSANALGMAIEFNQERETYLVDCGDAMAQGMPLLLQEV